MIQIQLLSRETFDHMYSYSIYQCNKYFSHAAPEISLHLDEQYSESSVT